MHYIQVAGQLAHNAETIRCMVQGIVEEQARWKPTPEQWSMLEVINHLYDEEREDFRQRLDLTLHQPDQPWPPIDPTGWVTARSYNQRNLAESLHRFLNERQQSVVWLQGLVSPAWETARTHPAGFTLSAGDLLASWLAHDFLHLRQLVELHYAWVQQCTAPFVIGYAGDW